MKSLKPRLLTAIIGIPLIILIIILSELWRPLLPILLSLVTAVMIGEYLYGNKLLKTYIISIPCIVFAAGVCMLAAYKLMFFIYIAVFALLMIVFFASIVRHDKINYSDLSYAFTGTALITLGTASIAFLCMRSLSLSFFFAICFAVPWMADAGAFFAGSLFGKHKLCPNISPKKTVEGAIGGVFTCVLAAVAIGFLFGNLITPQLTVNFIPLIIIGVCDAVLSIVGDLSFSLIKRTIGIKDYSNLFPGHGGMLDRFDSIIFTVPMVLIVNSFLPILCAG